MQVQIEASWQPYLQAEFNKPYFADLVQFVKQEYSRYTVYPPGNKIFHAFDACPFQQVRVVIIGQDPYHEPGQAHGLCFSVNDGVPFPPSLQNIFKEIQTEFDTEIPTSGNLQRWATQGVLLLNATLTVRRGQAGSHQNHGWETFTDAVIHLLAHEKQHVVYLLWGAYARSKARYIDRCNNLVLESAHPSPLSSYRGFFGNQHFLKANAYLTQTGQVPIVW